MTEIIIRKRGDDYSAHIADHPGKWEAGRTQHEAACKLLTSHPDVFGITFRYDSHDVPLPATMPINGATAHVQAIETPTPGIEPTTSKRPTKATPKVDAKTGLTRRQTNIIRDLATGKGRGSLSGSGYMSMREYEELYLMGWPIQGESAHGADRSGGMVYYPMNRRLESKARELGIIE